MDLQSVFDNLVDITEPICQDIDGNLASMLLFDTSGIEAYPGVERGSQEWDDTYKIRVNVEKSINHFKDSFCVANRKTTNEKHFMRIYFLLVYHSY